MPDGLQADAASIRQDHFVRQRARPSVVRDRELLEVAHDPYNHLFDQRLADQKSQPKQRLHCELSGRRRLVFEVSIVSPTCDAERTGRMRVLVSTISSRGETLPCNLVPSPIFKQRKRMFTAGAPHPSNGNDSRERRHGLGTPTN